jgi:hypothetical protein
MKLIPHGNAKLTWKQVKWIRIRGIKYTQIALAKMFHVGRTTIRDVITHKTWEYPWNK